MAKEQVETVLRRWGYVGYEFCNGMLTVTFPKTLSSEEQMQFGKEFLQAWAESMPKQKVYLRLKFEQS